MTIERARRARAAQGVALAGLATGRIPLSEALRHPPKALRSVDLYVCLMRTPGMGKDRCRQVCERAHVWPHLTLEELSIDQRMALINELPMRIP